MNPACGIPVHGHALVNAFVIRVHADPEHFSGFFKVFPVGCHTVNEGGLTGLCSPFPGSRETDRFNGAIGSFTVRVVLAKALG